MTTLTLDLPAELVARLEHAAGESGQSLDTLVAGALAAHFAPSALRASTDTPMASERIRLRPVRLAGWPADGTFRREEIYGDDGLTIRSSTR